MCSRCSSTSWRSSLMSLSRRKVRSIVSTCATATKNTAMMTRVSIRSSPVECAAARADPTGLTANSFRQPMGNNTPICGSAPYNHGGFGWALSSQINDPGSSSLNLAAVVEGLFPWRLQRSIRGRGAPLAGSRSILDCSSARSMKASARLVGNHRRLSGNHRNHRNAYTPRRPLASTNCLAGLVMSV